MNQADYQLGKKYPLIRNELNKEPLGIAGIIQQMAIAAKFKHEQSLKTSAEMDRAGLIQDDRTDNGASAEDIGCHSLMAKDSDRKQPLRQEAINLATCVVLYVAKIMVRQVETGYVPSCRADNERQCSGEYGAQNTVDRMRVDWLHLLRHFLSHPDESEGPGMGWWVDALGNPQAKDYHELKSITKAEVERRIREEKDKRTQLETKYNNLAKDAEAGWTYVPPPPRAG